MPCVGIARAGWIRVVLAVAASIWGAGTALAQVKDVAAGFVVVTKDKADLRCGETTNYYKVAELAAGTLLTVDGEAGDFARVSYPDGVTALIKAEEVRYDDAAKTATVTQATKLRATNVLMPTLVGSWKGLLSQPLAVGTSLKVVESVKDTEGRVNAYRVPAPAAARGFVRRADVRQATAQEIEAARAKHGGTPPPATKPAPSPAPAPTVEPAKPANTPNQGAGGEKTPPAPGDHSLVEPMVKPGEKPPAPTTSDPATPPATNPATPPAPTPAPGTAPAAEGTQPAPSGDAGNGGKQPEPAVPAAPKAPTLNDLERAFDNLRKQEPDEAEYQALIGEFKHLQETTTASSRLHKQIQGRIDWMNMKLEIRERQRQIEDMKRQADSQGREVTTKLAELERQRQYAIVGRLLPSNIYDGTNLPLMYRLQSVTGGMAPRTVGYIKPSAELDLPTKLNQVVGVIGEIKMDPGMSLNIITAQRVDILQSTDGGPVRNP